MKSTPLACLTGLAAILTLGGCGVETQTLESIREVVQTVHGTANDVSPATASPATAEKTPEIAFEPPYPDRIDPFSFPAGFGAGGPAEVTSPSMMQVQVLGFADVEEPRVFLRSRETTRSLRVGDTVDGIEVLAIKAPAVDLRMGSLVWTATMFDQVAVPPAR